MAPRNPPLSNAEKARIRDLHDQGQSRNQIAEALGRSGSTISNFCDREGLIFPHPQKEQAVTARELSVRERVVAAYERQLKILELQQSKILAAYETGEWKAKLKATGGAESQATLDFIPADDERNITGAVQSTATALKNLTPAGDEAKETAVSMADQLAAQLGLPLKEGETK